MAKTLRVCKFLCIFAGIKLITNEQDYEKKSNDGPWTVADGC